MRKKCVWYLFIVCLLVALLGGCGGEEPVSAVQGPPVAGLREGVYIGMTKDALIQLVGQPALDVIDEDGHPLVEYDAETLFGMTFRSMYVFDDTGLIHAQYVTDYVEPEVAKKTYDQAYASVVKALSGRPGYLDDGTEGTIGSDERVTVNVSAENFTVHVSYEYGMLGFDIIKNK